MQKISRVMVSCLALLAFASTASSQQAFPEHGVRQTIISRSSAPTQRVTVTWGSANDGRFSADTYHVAMTLVNADSAWSIVRKQTITSAVIDIPLKKFYNDSVGLFVRVRASRRGVLGTDSVYGIRWYKRQLSTSERAHIDTFPAANHKTVLCSLYGQKFSDDQIASALAMNLASKTKTIADSAQERNYWSAIKSGPDSVFTPQTCGATFCLTKGYRYGLAVLIKNRYTGRVRVDTDDITWTVSDPSIADFSKGTPDCAKKIAEWESQRDS